MSANIEVIAWTATTSMKHPLGVVGFDQELTTYSFVGKVKSCNSSAIIQYKNHDRVAGIVTSYQLKKRGCLPKELSIDTPYLVPVPDKIASLDCTVSLLIAVKAYTAFQTLANTKTNDTVLICNYCNDHNSVAVILQLCKLWNYKVILLTIDDSTDHLRSLLNNHMAIFRVNFAAIDKTLTSVMDWTNSIGVSTVLELGFNEALSRSLTLSDLFTLVAPFGHVITDRHTFKLSETDSNLLHLKSASVQCLFAETWILSPTRLGQYQLILRNIMENIKQKIIQPKTDGILEVKNPKSEISLTKQCTVYTYI